jgi:hypothetical protein
MSHCPCVKYCDLTTCYSIENANQRLKLTYNRPLANLAFDFNLRRYAWGKWPQHT